jgi:hypothetical protein
MTTVSALFSKFGSCFRLFDIAGLFKQSHGSNGQQYLFSYIIA